MCENQFDIKGKKYIRDASRNEVHDKEVRTMERPEKIEEERIWCVPGPWESTVGLDTTGARGEHYEVMLSQRRERGRERHMDKFDVLTEDWLAPFKH